MTSAMRGREGLRVGAWVLEPSRGRIRCGSRAHHLEPRVMQVLLELVQTPGETVSREHLRRRVWGDAVVTDDALHRCIAVLRRTLGQGEHGVRIETIPKVGYRLAVDDGPARRASARPRWVVYGASGAVVVAVLAGTVWRLDGTADPHRPSVRPLTTLPGHELMPAISADGSHVAYVRRHAEEHELYVITVGGGAPLRLTDQTGREHAPAYAPDGTRIAFARSDESGCSVHVVAPTGGPEGELFRCAFADTTELAWSPNGNLLAYLDRPAAGAPLAVRFFALSGDAPPTPEPPSTGIGDGDLAFSLDGKSLVFSRSPALGVEDVHLYDLETEHLSRVTHDHIKVHGLAFLEADTLVLSSNRGGSFGLWRQPVSGGEPALLPAIGRHHDEPSASSQRIVYEAWRAEVNLHAYPIDAPIDWTRPPLIASTHFDWDPSVGPDGRVAFVSDRSGAAEVWVAQAGGRDPLQLTHFGGPYVHAPQWSPDGRLIAMAAPVGGNFDIYTVAASGGPVARVTHHPARERAPAFASDGARLYFASDRSGRFEIWQMALDGSAGPSWIAEGRRAREKGEWLYYTKERRDGLWRRRLAGGDEACVVPGLTPVDERNWVIDGEAVIFVDRPVPSEPRLVRLDLDTGARQQLGAIPRFYHKSGLALDPERRLWLSRVASSETDLYIIHLER